MRRSFQWTIILGVLLALTLGVAACGGGDDNGGSSGEQGTSQGSPAEGKKGGKLVALWAGDVDFIDPGITYYQMGNQIVRATQKQLYRPKIDDASQNVPDLAESDPQISADGWRGSRASRRTISARRNAGSSRSRRRTPKPRSFAHASRSAT